MTLASTAMRARGKARPLRTGVSIQRHVIHASSTLAPTNAAFQKLPAGTVDTLLKPENKPVLTKVLTYHVVAGRLSSVDLKKQIKAGNGTAMLKTVSGGTLWAMMHDNDVVLKDEKGGMSMVTQANVFQSNGVIHVVDTVVLPQ